MMIRSGFIIHFLIIGNLLFTYGQCANGSFKFEVELIDGPQWSLPPKGQEGRQDGPQLTRDVETREKLCAAAMGYISFAFKDPIDPELARMPWGQMLYPDKEPSEEYFNYLWCESSPRDRFVIMVGGFRESRHSYYGMMPKDFSFTVKFVSADPVHSATDRSEKDNIILSKIEDDDLRKEYQQMDFMDWMLVCLKAQDHIRENYPDVMPFTHPSTIGYRLLKFYCAETNLYEEYVGYKCPIEPSVCAYLENSPTIGIVLY